jgi:hypothetical protein
MRKFQVGVTESRRELIVQAAAALGALLIVISLFLPWFSVGLGDSVKALAQTGVQQELESTEELGVVDADLDDATELIDSSINYSGWSSLEFADALLLFVAIAGVMLALGRRRGHPEADRREAGDALLLLGLLAVVTVLVLLFTKNSVLGMLGSTIDFGQDKADDLGQVVPDIELLDISAGLGLWLGLIGSLLTLTAGFFHSLVEPTGVEPVATETQPTTPAAGTESPTQQL